MINLYFRELQNNLNFKKNWKSKKKQEAEEQRLLRLEERKHQPITDLGGDSGTPEELPSKTRKEHAPRQEPDIHLGKLQTDFPRRARELKDRDRLIGDLSSDILLVANQVWLLAINWLAYLDGDDFELCKDRHTYDQIARVSQRANLTIEQVTEKNMYNIASSLYDFEISLALLACVDEVGTELRLNGNVDETFELLVTSRDRALMLWGPPNRRISQYRNGIADTRYGWATEVGDEDTYPWWESRS